LTETAEADLAEIWAYIAEHSEAATNRLPEKILTTLARARATGSFGPGRARS
jgi:plasmid stabilization system protein ParE